MDAATVKTITEYLCRVRENYADFEGAYVFGSYARGNYTADSDIDLALVFTTLNDSPAV
jgi:predicted nucleotidyltransferase